MRLAVSILTNIICRGTWVIGIPCRSYLCRTTPFGRFKHLFLSKIVIATGRFKLRFKPIQKNSTNAEVKGVYPRDFSNSKCSNNHANHNQCQRMTVNKLDYFLRSIQSMLKFLNGIYLHGNQQFYLIRITIVQILLKIHKLKGAIPGFSQYSSQNNNTIWTKL